MVKAKRYSETDFANFYAVSPVFKKYSKFNLWSENFNEYNNIRYCEIYFSQYFFSLTQKYLLENFSHIFLLTLYNNSKFLKFLKSGFFKYINFHFLLLFQSNRFFFFGNFSKEVEIFVEEYFQRYIQKNFEQDLLICIISCIIEIVPKSFIEYLKIRFKVVYKELLVTESNTKSLSNSLVILNFTENKKIKYYYLGFIDYKNTIKNFYFEESEIRKLIKIKAFYFILSKFTFKIYKSLSVIKKIPEYIETTFFLEGTMYNWGNYVINIYKKLSSQTFNYILYNLSKTSISYKYFVFTSEVGLSLKSYSFVVSPYWWCFYIFSNYFYKSLIIFVFKIKEKGSKNYNYNFYYLLEVSKILISFDKKKHDIGIYRESSDVFFKGIKPTYLKLVDTVITKYLKNFKYLFVTFYNKISNLLNLAKDKKVLLINYNKSIKNLNYLIAINYKIISFIQIFEENNIKFYLRISNVSFDNFKNYSTDFKPIINKSSYILKVKFENI